MPLTQFKKKDMYLYNFEIWTKHNDKIYSKIYNKFCRYPKKTKLYKDLIKQLNEEKITRLTIYLNT